MNRLITGVVLLFLTSQTWAAYDVSKIYPEPLLEYWQQKYRSSVQWNFDSLVLGSLTPTERRKLGKVKLVMPLRGPGKLRGDPMVFYAQQRQVVAPVQSILFFDQLAQAMAYLSVKQLSPEPVYDYLSMLKYRELPPGSVADPLVTLGIPAEPWKLDKRIDNASQNMLKSAIVWILGHELGHIFYQHPGYGPGVTRTQAQQNEQQADKFANELMRRIGVAPSGMVPYFMAMAYWSPHRGDFDSDQAWQRFLTTESTHPLTANRMILLAESLAADAPGYAAAAEDPAAEQQTVVYVAEQIHGIAEILSDPQIQRAIAARGRATSPTRLSIAPKKAHGETGLQSFNGIYQGSWTHVLSDGSEETLAASMALERRGNNITGWFQFGLGEGRIEGVVKGNSMSYQWVWGTSGGFGVLTQHEDGSLEGGWGYHDNHSGGGHWDLKISSN